MEKIINGSFTIPKNLDAEVNKTEFTFILYFFYDPIINDIEYQKNLNEQNDSTSIVLYKNQNPGKRIMKSSSNIFTRITNFIKKNIDEIFERVVAKAVSTVCVSIIKYLFQDMFNIIVQSVGQFACD